jgi:hypothetical protein
MQQFAGTSLKTRLYLLVLAAFIPVAILILYIAEEQKDNETRAILQKTVMLARAAANEENQQLESTRSLLTILSDTFLMAENRADRLSGLLVNLIRQSKGYVEFGIAAPEGRLLVASGASTKERDFKGRSWFSTCLQSK